MGSQSARIILAAAALAVSSAAMAADLPVKAPIMPVVATYSWTGFYAGVNLGYSWGKSDNSFNTFNPNSNVGTGGFTSTACPPNVGLPVAAAFCAIANDSARLNGVIGGGQIGYNWQAGNWVFGLETDIQGSGERGGGNLLFPSIGTVVPPIVGIAVIPGGTNFGLVGVNYSESLDWFGTFRGRVGVLASPSWLLYATGGLAYGQVSTSGSSVATANTFVLGGCSAQIAASPGPATAGLCGLGNWSSKTTRVGWTVGAGVEGVLSGNWTWKAEYLHVDLGTFSTGFTTGSGCFGLAGTAPACLPTVAGTGTFSSRVTDEIFRVGVNYRFSGGPVVARY